jgi:C-terminal processing protease CtpA/Prc
MQGIHFKSFVLVVVGFLPFAAAQTEALNYLNQTIDILEHYVEDRDKVDWETLRQEALEQAKDATTTADTYPIIRSIIREKLQDRTSYLHAPLPGGATLAPSDYRLGFRVLLPDWVVVYVFPESPAEQAGMKLGDIVVSVNDKLLSEVDLTPSPLYPDTGARYFECETSYADYCHFLKDIYTPGAKLEMARVGEEHTLQLSIADGEYTTRIPASGWRIGDIGYIEVPPGGIDSDIARSIIAEIDREPTCGWVIDTRRQAGGGLDLMAIYPLWIEASKSTLKQREPPLALLLSRLTHSGGESLATSFEKMVNTRTFGEHTGGNHPSVKKFELSDGAVLGVTLNSGGHQPNVEVKIDWTLFQTENDPVIKAAMEWLMQQPSCQGN